MHRIEAYLSTFSRSRAFIWKLESGSASKWKVGSASTSNWQAGSGSASSWCGPATQSKTTLCMPCGTGTTKVRQAAMPPSRQQRAEVRRDPSSSPGPPTCTAVPPLGLTAPTLHPAASPLTTQVSVPSTCSWSSVQVTLVVRSFRKKKGIFREMYSKNSQVFRLSL